MCDPVFDLTTSPSILCASTYDEDEALARAIAASLKEEGQSKQPTKPPTKPPTKTVSFTCSPLSLPPHFPSSHSSLIPPSTHSTLPSLPHSSLPSFLPPSLHPLLTPLSTIRTLLAHPIVTPVWYRSGLVHEGDCFPCSQVCYLVAYKNC